jgi:hypothetical protein
MPKTPAQGTLEGDSFLLIPTTTDFLLSAIARDHRLGKGQNRRLTDQAGWRRLSLASAIAVLSAGLVWGSPSEGNQPVSEKPSALDNSLIDSSSNLRRWLKQTPDLFEENRHDPAFLPTIRFGYSYFAAQDHPSGFGVGVQDWFLGSLPLSISADYQTNLQGQQAGGGNLQYYLMPLGWDFNITPVVGYRSVQQDDFHSDGINLGGKVVFALSRTGAADIRLSQMFTAPGTDREVGTSNLSVGYALSSHWRLATDLQQQNSRGGKESRVGLYLEWQP